MARRQSRDIVRRCKGNPIITPDDLSFRCSDICTAGAVKHDGEYILLVTIQSLEGYSSIYVARSIDGYTFDVADKPLLAPEREGPMAEFQGHGVLDARVTFLDGEYYLAHDVIGRHGYCLALTKTKDFESTEFLGVISQPDTKAGALFPKKINGRYARLERPWNGGSIWVTYSDDLTYWGWTECVMTPRGGFWDPSRIGTASPPMEIDQGWLIVYYGVKETSAGPLFRLGAAILDKENPAKVVGRTNVPILSPRENYERIGDVPNMVFSCGAILEPKGELKLYYGASNSCVCIGTTDVDTIVEACLQSEKEF